MIEFRLFHPKLKKPANGSYHQSSPILQVRHKRSAIVEGMLVTSWSEWATVEHVFEE